MGHGHDHDDAHGGQHHHGHAHGGHDDHGHAHGDDHGHAHGDDHGHAHGGHDDHGHAHGDDHGHAHGDDHGHAHGDDHGHAHDHPRAPLLEEGAGTGKVLFFDAFSGIAGDMTIAALLDLGVPLLVIERAVAALPLDGFHLHRGHAHRSGIVATSFDVHVEAPQPERTYGSIDAMLAAAPLDPPVAALARRIFRRLGEAEAAVHRIRLEDVHFHEVGAVDAIVDIVGSAAAIVHIGAEVVGSPLPMGRGFVKARHGILPLPPPAAVACLRGVPTYGVELDAELVTPTGAAIIATLATRFERWPTFAPDRIGFGAGQRELPDRPNLLRVVLGTRTGGDESLGSASHVIVEANVDDLTGEVAGHAIEALFAAGALDAWAAPITMKKGRPALTIAALAAAPQADAVATALLRETTSIGLRKIPVGRTERPRRITTVQTAYGAIRVKISEGPFGPPQIKPEFDDCAAAARTHGVPVREVVSAALSAAKK
ncbi:nickel pincer cofactor biosynthesis protein LarC [Sorangium sp. So ce448]|uniref:nickel pincer cofactor biosynthesis protein LarC n=1 Tax=Sorangium sp. So ce448 TaxID=3133314 RepID=UPI003F648A21